MKKNDTKFGTLGLIWTLFMLIVTYAVFMERKKNVWQEVQSAFTNAIQKEKKQFVEHRLTLYDKQKSPNDIPFEEKIEWANQACLFCMDSNRHRLDSLFRVELDERGISLQSQVYCSFKSMLATGGKQDGFLQKAVLVDERVYRKDYDASNQIILCSYIQSPTGWLFNHWSNNLLAVVYLTGMAVLVYFQKRKKVSKAVQKKISFSQEQGVLKQGEMTVQLTGDSLIYFRCFLDKKEYFLTKEEILAEVYHDKTAEITSLNRSRISHAIKILRDKLEKFDSINIESIRGQGYRLVASDLEIV